MTDPHEVAAKAVEDVMRAIDRYAPGASNVEIKTVNVRGSEIELIDFQADLPDGSHVRVPRVVINLG
jgi:hypothetical protein